ncbi:hypothetical protein [uncultured Microbulbifer sp.]|uniref:portal protein n=1 Tax=uncultured Microbulbifer sp. TaxID=348147 RepID=UPI002613FBD2|nr:hypothetical protein [uncultured Microbulbifer sp.]
MNLQAEISSEEVESVRDLIKRCVHDFPFFALKQLKIATKRGALKPLKLNRAQRYVHERLEDQLFELGMVRALILKGRQQGISTYVEGRYYWKTRFRKAVKAFILTHLQQATDNLFDMVFRYHNNLHPLLKPATANASSKELHFAQNDSGYKVATAGSKGAGRSSTIHYFHGSEVAFWPHAETHAAGVLQAVPEGENSEIIFESTANGIGGYFHDLWQKAEAGESEFIAIFLPWYWQPEYRKKAPSDWKPSDTELDTAKTYNLDRDQLYWAHQKNIQLRGDVGEWGWLFLQEYPFCAADAFQQSGQDTRADWVVRPDDDDSVEVAEGINEKLNEAARMTRSDKACADAFAGQVKCGLDWVEVSRSSDPFAYPYRCKRVHRNEIFWDWHAESDLSNARWLVRRRWVDRDQAELAFPGHKDLIRFACQGWDGFDTEYQLMRREDLLGAYSDYTATDMFLQDWWDSDRERALIYEVYSGY